MLDLGPRNKIYKLNLSWANLSGPGIGTSTMSGCHNNYYVSL